MTDDQYYELSLEAVIALVHNSVAEAIGASEHKPDITPESVAAESGLTVERIMALSEGNHDGFVPMDELYKLADAMGCEVNIKYHYMKPHEGAPPAPPAMQKRMNGLLAPEKGLTLADLEYDAFVRNMLLMLTFDRKSED